MFKAEITTFLVPDLALSNYLKRKPFSDSVLSLKQYVVLFLGQEVCCSIQAKTYLHNSLLCQLQMLMLGVPMSTMTTF
jgi:hypothetical protein